MGILPTWREVSGKARGGDPGDRRGDDDTETIGVAGGSSGVVVAGDAAERIRGATARRNVAAQLGRNDHQRTIRSDAGTKRRFRGRLLCAIA